MLNPSISIAPFNSYKHGVGKPAVMTLTLQVRELILDFMDSRGHNRQNVAEASLLYGCSVRTIWRLIRLRLETGSLDFRTRGHGSKNWVGIPTVEIELLLQELQTDPTLYLSEMADFLLNAGYPAYSPRQIWAALKSRNLTRKVLEVHAREQNERKRQEFLRITSIYTAEQRFYVDESHLTEKSIRRRYGRSDINVRAFVHLYNRHGHRGSCSAIAAMSTKGIEVVSMHEEMIDGETYLRVLEDCILPLMNPFPLEKSVLFNDNAPVHNKAAIITLCQTHGVIPVFFEPYSYDYNPIELVFHRAKDYCRAHFPLDDPNFPLAQNFEKALYNCILGDTACNFFTHCHINVTSKERERAVN